MTDIQYRTCKSCQGTGEVDVQIPDMGDLDVVRKELIESVTNDGEYGLMSESRAWRIRTASRAIRLANQIVSLENRVKRDEIDNMVLAEYAANPCDNCGEGAFVCQMLNAQQDGSGGRCCENCNH